MTHAKSYITSHPDQYTYSIKHGVTCESHELSAVRMDESTGQCAPSQAHRMIFRGLLTLGPRRRFDTSTGIFFEIGG